ncbi:MAG: hypothetical protein AB8C84_10820 [Oligoflexales bacterium]
MEKIFLCALLLIPKAVMSAEILKNEGEGVQKKMSFIEGWARNHVANQTSENYRLLLGSVVFAPCKELHEHLMEASDSPLKNDLNLQNLINISPEEAKRREHETCSMIGFSVASFQNLKPEQDLLEAFDHNSESEYGFIVQVMDQGDLTPEAAVKSLAPDFDLDMRMFQMEQGDVSDEFDSDSEDEPDLIQQYFSLVGGASLDWLEQVWRKTSRVVQECVEA